MVERMWSTAADLMAVGKLREKKGLGQGRSKGTPLGPTSSNWAPLPVSTNSAINLGIHQWINSPMRSEPSPFNHVPKAPGLNTVLGTKPSAHELSETFHVQTTPAVQLGDHVPSLQVSCSLRPCFCISLCDLDPSETE
jgi:hypothetical protein